MTKFKDSIELSYINKKVNYTVWYQEMEFLELNEITLYCKMESQQSTKCNFNVKPYLAETTWNIYSVIVSSVIKTVYI